MKKNGLQSATYVVTGAVANYGSAIPAGMNRYIYRIKAINLFNGANLLTVTKQENGAVIAAVVDYIQAALQYDTWVDPDNLLEGAAPLYIIGGAGAGGASFIRLLAAAGTVNVTVWYEDASSPS